MKRKSPPTKSVITISRLTRVGVVFGETPVAPRTRTPKMVKLGPSMTV